MALIYFGQVKVHSERRLIEAPIGLPCLHCGHHFKLGDSGIVLPWSTEDGEASGAYHIKCFAVDVLGLDLTA